MIQPTISIIMSVWNGEDYIEAAINSVLDQKYPNKELIIVDDGSEDSTAKIIKKFAPHIKSFFHKNQGKGASCNLGIKLSSGSHLAFIDYDDYWEKDRLTAQVDFFRAQPNDPIVFGKVKQFMDPALSEDDKQKLLVNLVEQPAYLEGSALISRARFEQVGYFIEERKLGIFLDWCLRAKEQNIPFVNYNKLLLYRRIHKNNMGRQLDRYSPNDYLHIIKASLDRKRAL